MFSSVLSRIHSSHLLDSGLSITFFSFQTPNVYSAQFTISDNGIFGVLSADISTCRVTAYLPRCLCVLTVTSIRASVAPPRAQAQGNKDALCESKLSPFRSSSASFSSLFSPSLGLPSLFLLPILSLFFLSFSTRSAPCPISCLGKLSYSSAQIQAPLGRCSRAPMAVGRPPALLERTYSDT